MTPRGISWAMVQTGEQRKPSKLEVLCDEIDDDLEELRERLLRRSDTSPGFRPEEISRPGS